MPDTAGSSQVQLNALPGVAEPHSETGSIRVNVGKKGQKFPKKVTRPMM